MLENDFIFWIVGSILGAAMAFFMATREYRWLRRPPVVALAAVLSAWIASLVAITTTSPTATGALMQAAAAAWGYPWLWLVVLNYWRHNIIAVRILHLPILAIWLTPLSLVLASLALLFTSATPTAITVALPVAAGLGTIMGQILVQSGLHKKTIDPDSEPWRRYKRALLYPTIDGKPLKSSPPEPKTKRPGPQAAASADPSSDPGFINLDLDSIQID